MSALQQLAAAAGLSFRYRWAGSDETGWVRTAALTNLGREPVERGETRYFEGDDLLMLETMADGTIGFRTRAGAVSRRLRRNHPPCRDPRVRRLGQGSTSRLHRAGNPDQKQRPGCHRRAGDHQAQGSALATADQLQHALT